MSDGCRGGELTDPHPPSLTSAPPRVIYKVHFAGAATESIFRRTASSHMEEDGASKPIPVVVGGADHELHVIYVLAFRNLQPSVEGQVQLVDSDHVVTVAADAIEDEEQR
ncbi:hypothetical protein ACLOJK_019547 [Asimina triloba]